MPLDLDLADNYAVLIKNLAFLAGCGNHVTENLFFALTNAKRDFGGERSAAAAKCIEALAHAMADELDADVSVTYNAVLHWAIKDLQEG